MDERQNYSREYYLKHIEYFRQKSREYDQTHAEQRREYQRAYYAKNINKMRKKRIKERKLYVVRIRAKVFAHYSKNGEIKCACCACTDEWALKLDHIHNNGAEERKHFRKGCGSGTHFYSWLLRNNYPEGYQILCRNCNWGKKLFGECPHKNPLKLC